MLIGRVGVGFVQFRDLIGENDPIIARGVELSARGKKRGKKAGMCGEKWHISLSKPSPYLAFSEKPLLGDRWELTSAGVVVLGWLL